MIDRSGEGAEIASPPLCCREKTGTEGRAERKMECLSLDYKSAGVDGRKRFAMTARVREALYGQFKNAGGCVAVITCGRSEFYFTCAKKEAETILRTVFGAETDAFRFYEDEQALQHLFALTAGLCSMLVGEDEILGQVREGYETARKSGMTGRLDAVFQSALSCGKKVRSRTGISSQACSLATLAANAVFSFKEGRKEVLVIGAAGKIGGSVLKNLAAGKNTEITATLRTHAFTAEAAGVRTIPYESRYTALNDADCVVCATASPHTVLQADEVRRGLKEEKARLFIDMAVPPDIDAAVAEIPGCTLLGIDGFLAQAEENNRKKEKAKEQACLIVEECVAEFLADEAARENAEKIRGLGDEQRRALYALRKEDPRAFVEKMKEQKEGVARNE